MDESFLTSFSFFFLLLLLCYEALVNTAYFFKGTELVVDRLSCEMTSKFASGTSAQEGTSDDTGDPLASCLVPVSFILFV